MLTYHHCRDLSSVIFGKVKTNPKYSDKIMKEAYSWLEKEIGFYPLFLSVGTIEEDIRMTGYQNQWARFIGSKIIGRRNNGTYIQKNILRKKGEFPNYVLFSFENIDGIYMDYHYWHLALNASHKNYQMSNYEKRLIFKPSWKKSKWLSYAKRKPHSVQLVIPNLDLRKAKRVWVRNKKTKKFLESVGFRNVDTKRIKIEY